MNGDIDWNCEVCGKPIKLILTDGIPDEAPVCSNECYKIFRKRYNKERSNDESNHGICKKKM